MKTTFFVLAAAGAAMAQDLAALPQCGQTCVNNMINIAQTQFGCAQGDAQCFCGNADFGFGIRDCASQACGSQDETAQVISYGTSYCEQALQSAQPSASTSAVGILTSALATATQTTGTAMETTMATATSGAMASASSALESASDAASSLASSISEVASSASASASNAASSAASKASSIAASASDAASSAVASATSDGAAQPMKTAFPMAGAVGIAAMLFI